MKLLLDSFWRAIAYCFHPRAIGLSLLPLLLMLLLWGVLGYFYWEPLLGSVQAALESSATLTTVGGWLQGVGLGGLKAVLAPLIVIAVATPVIVMTSLLAVALLLTPVVVSLVARRRFGLLERRHGASYLDSFLWAVGSVLLAVLVMLVSMPLWLIPPLAMFLPPLIWGWVTYRVLAFDALAQHASGDERRALFERHRVPFLVMGCIAGYAGAVPTLVLASGPWTVVWFPILMPLVVWLYTLIFTFSSLWFAHYCLSALETMRREIAVAAQAAQQVPVATLLHQPPNNLQVPTHVSDS